MSELPIAVIGAGPVGLAAAAQCAARGLDAIVFERGRVGEALRAWAHVRVFSPWTYNIDAAARTLLETAGWTAPDPDALPTGGEIVARYLEPLATLPQIAPRLQLGARVTAITRLGLDKLADAGRDSAPFEIRWTDLGGGEHATLARAVIDTSGTWLQPNPMGADGLPVPGERALGDRLVYGIPDVLGRDRAAYAGKTILVVGSGHSAINSVLALLALRQEAPDTRIIWALRRNRIDRLLGGGLNDQLPERGAVGLAARRAIDEGRLQLLAPFAATRLTPTHTGVSVTGRLGQTSMTLLVDRIIVATGFRPDLGLLSELRIATDPATEAPPALAPLIDPNFHSCGTVPPHGVVELSHPEPGFYIAGAKSYGRAPTFLMATGYEQVRSIVAELAGDPVAARQVQLVLPETGVCSTDLAAATCCASPATCCTPETESLATASCCAEPATCCGGPATRDAARAARQPEPA